MTEERYYWLTGQCPRDNYELISYSLFEAGAHSIQELDESNDSTVYFKICENSKAIITELYDQFSEYMIERGDEENVDWDESWRSQQKAVPVTDTLFVYPPWVERIARENGIDILLEAKQAFGTGTHESTSLIIRLMEQVLREKGLLPDKPTLLDIGTGTGILAMYAEKLCGAQTVVTEIDPVTIPCIVENFQLNSCPPAQGILGFLDAFKQAPAFDIILCNMIRTELWPMRQEMETLLNDNGLLLISGQLLKEKEYILDWFSEVGIAVHHDMSDGEWWAVAGRKRV
ncbi:MAG: 50S ribosomal protein L11 methyltransferase [Fibrobacterales bacterium]